MTDKGIKPEDFVVDIHGKPYMQVAGRVLEAHQGAGETLSITTELLSPADDDLVAFKATVEIDGRTYTGHAVSYKSRSGVEGQNPYEVAETSAVGRALGFAGFGIVSGIPSAEEMQQAENNQGAVVGFNGSKNPKYKEVFGNVVKAQVYSDINNILQSEDFKGLDVEEKRGIQARVRKQMLNLKGDEEVTNG
jgi:hypothetical protein